MTKVINLQLISKPVFELNRPDDLAVLKVNGYNCRERCQNCPFYSEIALIICSILAYWSSMLLSRVI
jgi:hypothetical protein